MSLRVKVSKVFVDGREMAGKDIEVEFDDDWRILHAAQRLRIATDIRHKRAAELGTIEAILSTADAAHDSAIRGEQAALENLTKTVNAVTL